MTPRHAAEKRSAAASAATAMPAASGDRLDRIRELAYQYFVERGGDDGHALDDWLRAEAQVHGQAPQGNGQAGSARG